MSKYVLKHGSFVELSDEELMHWKYIKKVKKNGKWVYYYDNHVERDLRRAEANYKEAEHNRNRANISQVYSQAQVNNYSELLKSHFPNDYKRDKAINNQRIADYVRAGNEYAKAKQKYDSASSIYKKSTVSRAVAKFAVKAANWLSNLFS